MALLRPTRLSISEKSAIYTIKNGPAWLFGRLEYVDSFIMTV